MKKLLEDYKENGAVKSKLASFIWKVGVISSSIFYCIDVLYHKNDNCNMLIYFFTILFLFIISGIVFIIKASKKVNFIFDYKRIFSIRQLKLLVNTINEYQKKWITNYCKKNKLNNFNKLNVIMQELKSEKDRTTIKYINPIILGTLSLTIWEIAIQKVVEKIGFINMLPLAFVSIIGISLIIGWVKKQFLEDKDLIRGFETFSSKERLTELILYRILKSKK